MVMGVTSRLFAFVRFLYFPDEFILYGDVVVRTLFTLYYLPMMAVAVALTHSVLQSMVYSTIIPLTLELELLSLPQTLLPTSRDDDMTDLERRWFSAWMDLIIKLIPCCALGGAVVVIGHKVTNAIGEAMIDCFSKVDDKDYPLLSARLEFVLQKESRRQVFAASLCVLFIAFGAAFYSDYLLVWTSRNGEVLIAAWAIIFSQAIFVISTSLSTFNRNSTPNLRFYKHFVGPWWKSSIHRIRHLSMEMVLCCGIYWFLRRGVVDSMAHCVEVLLYLNIPHLFGFLVLSITQATARMLQSLIWLNRHRVEFPSILLLVAPQQALITFSFWCFQRHPFAVCLLSGLTIVLWSRGIELLRQFDTFGEGSSVVWRERDSGKRIPPYIAALLEDAHERRQPVPSMVSLDFSLDLAAMTMKVRNRNTTVSIERIDSPQPPRGGGSIRSLAFFAFACPRLFTMQSGVAFGGKRFGNVRVLLRTFTISLLLVFVFIVAGVVAQAAFPALRPLPVRVSLDGPDRLVIDHYLVELDLKRQSSSHDHGSGESVLLDDAYPGLCRKEVSRVNMWELAMLSTVVYVSSFDDQARILSFLHDPASFDWESRERYPNVLGVWNGFMEFFSPRRNATVVAVRGTDFTSFADALQDVNMFFEVALYHTLSSIVPGAALLPEELVSDFILLASGIESIGRTHSWPLGPSGRAERAPNMDYHILVQEYVSLISSLGETIVVTGHSLGGAIAQLVGTRLGLPSVGFSSPGLKLSHRKFGVELNELHKYTTTVVSSNDIVPLIGGQVGDVHHTECPASRRELCHAMENMVSTLWSACPSLRSSFPHIRVAHSSSFVAGREEG